jgi:CHAD domain-containing protein
LLADKPEAESVTITRASYRKNLRRTDRALAKKISAYLNEANERNVHDLRTTTRRMLAALQLLPKKLRNESKTVEYDTRLEKLMKSNAKTRDLDIVTGKVGQRNSSGEYDALLKRLRRLRESSLQAGLQYARALKADQGLPVRVKQLSGADIEKRFEKLSRKYASRMEKRLPVVVGSPEEKEELHRLREDTRKLRYILDLGDQKPLRKQLKALKSWQDVLGEIHDSDIFIEYLDERKKSDEKGSLLDDETVVRNRNYNKFRAIAKDPLKLAS